MFGLWVFVLPYAVGAGEIWASLKDANETNETEFLLAVAPTPAPTFPTTSYTLSAWITAISDVPTIEVLKQLAQADCGGCSVTPTLLFSFIQTMGFSGVTCSVFTSAVAIRAIASFNNVPESKVEAAVTCTPTRRLGSNGRHLATDDVNITSTVTTSDAAAAKTIKTNAEAAATNSAGFRDAFVEATSLTNLPVMSVNLPEVKFSVTYEVTSSTAVAVVPPNPADIAASIAQETGGATLRVEVDTPAPTPAPTVAPTPLPAGSTFAPTVTPTPAPPTPAPPTPAPPTPAPPTPAPPTPAPPTPAPPTPAPPTAAPTSAPTNTTSDEESGVTRSCLATAALSIVALAAFVASP